MKKLVSLLLALCLVCLSTAALAADADITGDWYGTMYGMGVTLTLNADNTYPEFLHIVGIFCLQNYKRERSNYNSHDKCGRKDHRQDL